jgi:hypothetical protein
MTLVEILKKTPAERAAIYRQWAADESDEETKAEYLCVAELLHPLQLVAIPA